MNKEDLPDGVYWDLTRPHLWLFVLDKEVVGFINTTTRGVYRLDNSVITNKGWRWTAPVEELFRIDIKRIKQIVRHYLPIGELKKSYNNDFDYNRVINAQDEIRSYLKSLNLSILNGYSTTVAIQNESYPTYIINLLDLPQRVQVPAKIDSKKYPLIELD